MEIILEKIREVVLAVVPVVAIVFLLHLTLTPLGPGLLFLFLRGAFLIVLGLSIFLFGVEIGIAPLGSLVGELLVRSNRIWVVAGSGLLLGFVISMAEPALHVFAGQIDAVTAGALPKFYLITVTSLGIGALALFGLVRIVKNVPLRRVLAILYGFILILGILSSPAFLGISFDASAATTGALAVPFLLALAVGISSLKKDSLASESDSFGLVGIVSAGAIISVLVMGLIAGPGELAGALPAMEGPVHSLRRLLPGILQDMALAFAPVLLILLLLWRRCTILTRRDGIRISKGLGYTFTGLVLFFLGVQSGFMEIGAQIGSQLAGYRSWVVVLVGFGLGLVTILAEPAVHVLAHQIEDVTSGYIRRPIVLGTLALGVGAAIGLAMLRILVPSIALWHYLLPGYAAAIVFSRYVSPLFVGIAFDSGGVASGPIIGTFVLAFAQGVAGASPGADVLLDGFGMITLVALTPILALQILGFLYRMRTKKKGIGDNGDAG